jgi:hypothetical protein
MKPEHTIAVDWGGTDRGVACVFEHTDDGPKLVKTFDLTEDAIEFLRRIKAPKDFILTQQGEDR